ncbi:SMI1/KNR4 family protein [Kitasatospora sp. NBC_01287]|uniref:SMI1/KNR4 family protein n=1 Tax=Kitasatospora sp. NBC_01287 TaxID=2903573 RepID=UPI0022543E50|nr:SMI1/KNR4 family protein [Kitasatospora sp. NBC_01287]MCX4747485.1 SMI1/KNR4 family protein [Kitasatospora sp. NBC_01287]
MTNEAGERQLVDSGVDWSGVREQVLALREASHAAEVFGARRQGSGHDFLLEPRLSESEVIEAESDLGVSFPPDYRAFLLDVGAGGAGPHYGVFPLRRDERGWHWVEGRGYRNAGTLLERPFPSVAERERRAEELDAREPSASGFLTSSRIARRPAPGTRSGRSSTRP